MSGRWARGSTRQWRETRALVLERDKRRCLIALPGEWVNRRGEVQRCRGVADCVHHTQAREVVGDDPEFLISACTPCNLKTGDPTRGDPAPRPATRW